MNDRWITVAFLALLAVAALTAHAGAWPVSLEDWEYRQLHDINGSISDQTDYPMKIWYINSVGVPDFPSDCYLQNHAQSDYDDVIVTSIGNTPALHPFFNFEPHLISGVHPATWQYFSLDIPSSGTQVYIYYGNPDATSQSNIKTTFPIFADHFDEGTLNGTLWSSSGSTITVAASVINLTGAGGNALITSVDTFGLNTTFEGAFKWSRTGNPYFGYYDIPTLYVFLQRSNSTYQVWSRKTGVLTYTNIPDAFIDTEWYRWELNRNSDWQHIVAINSTGYVNHTTNIFTVPASIRLFAPSGSWGYCDWVVIKKTVSPGPAHSSWYGEEHQIPPFIVNFSGSPLTGNNPLTVWFTDHSYNIDSDLAINCTIDAWQWSFGDGSLNSTGQNPSHTYTTSGVFDVALTVFNTTYGKSNSTVFLDYVTVGAGTPTPTPTPTTATPTPTPTATATPCQNCTGESPELPSTTGKIPTLLYLVLIGAEVGTLLYTFKDLKNRLYGNIISSLIAAIIAFALALFSGSGLIGEYTNLIASKAYNSTTGVTQYVYESPLTIQDLAMMFFWAFVGVTMALFTAYLIYEAYEERKQPMYAGEGKDE